MLYERSFPKYVVPSEYVEAIATRSERVILGSFYARSIRPKSLSNVRQAGCGYLRYYLITSHYLPCDFVNFFFLTLLIKYYGYSDTQTIFWNFRVGISRYIKIKKSRFFTA